MFGQMFKGWKFAHIGLLELKHAPKYDIFVKDYDLKCNKTWMKNLVQLRIHKLVVFYLYLSCVIKNVYKL